ncbi:hypothetical protein SEA_FRANCOB_159 [Streptomyces phage Francob]
MPRDDLTAPGMPPKAPHPVNCEAGKKHKPTTREMKQESNGQHLKYTYCTKCRKIP